MKKKGIIYTTAQLNGSWLLMSVDIALWLHKRDGYREIIVNCIPLNRSFNIFNLVMRFKNIFNYLKVNKLKKLCKYLLLIKSCKKKNSEITKFALGHLDHANLKISDLQIKFIRSKSKKKNTINSHIKVYKNVIIDYYKYFKISSLKRKKYLKYRVKNIFAGLHVLSEALRSDYRSFGSIFKSRIGIISAIYKLRSSLPIYEEIVLPIDVDAYVCGPDQEYLYGFFSKFLENSGAKFIETESMQYLYLKRQLKENFYQRPKILKIKNKAYTIDEKKIKQYYKKRIKKPWEAFTYIDYLKKGVSNSKKIIKFKKASAIVYLHSFTDAQYVFGDDGYYDLFDWALKTISILSLNKNISKVIVKSHPGIDRQYHPGDLKANMHLKSKFQNSNKVEWVDEHFDVMQIKNLDTIVGITHHGSVAEELVFSDIPVVASTFAPWGEKYNFGFWWNNYREYELFISGKEITKLEVSKFQKKELYRYAMDKYFSKYVKARLNCGLTWQDALKVYNIKKHHEFGENMDQIKNIISHLDPAGNEFQKYILLRLKKINRLRSIN